MTKKSEEKELMEPIEGLNEFDINALIVEGTDAVIEREVQYYDMKTGEEQQMRVYVRPLSHSNWNSIAQKVSKNDNISFAERVCADGWCDPQGLLLNLSDIRKVQNGVVIAVFEEIKIVSGQFTDRTEEKFLDKLAGVS